MSGIQPEIVNIMRDGRRCQDLALYEPEELPEAARRVFWELLAQDWGEDRQGTGVETCTENL